MFKLQLEGCVAEASWGQGVMFTSQKVVSPLGLLALSVVLSFVGPWPLALMTPQQMEPPPQSLAFAEHLNWNKRRQSALPIPQQPNCSPAQL